MTHLNAGGTEGGGLRFFLGLILMMIGGYLFFDSVRVTNSFALGVSLFNIGGMQMRSGMILVPFVFGIGLIFYDSKKLLGWVLAAGSIAAFFYGVLASTHFKMKPMTAFDVITILVLVGAGLGIFLSSLKPYLPHQSQQG